MRNRFSCLVWCIALLTIAEGTALPAQMDDVSFVASCDGTSQRYIRILPDEYNEDEEHDLLISLHGHGSDREQPATGMQDEFRATRDIAQRYRMILVCPDYRAKTSWMGPQAEADVVQIINDIKQRYHIGRVFISGASMGGAGSLTFAALHPELIDGVASMNGTANHLEYEGFQDAIAESFGGAKTKIPEEYKKRSAEYFPERFTMPVAIAAGGKDESVPAASVVRLAETLKKIGARVLLLYRPDGGHSTSYDDATAALEFITRRTP